VPVVGAIHHDERLSIVERHLGLMPSNESHVATAKIKQIGEAIAEQVDLDKLLALSKKDALDVPNKAEIIAMHSKDKVRIAIARDRAFGFYYADDLDALTEAGAEPGAVRCPAAMHLSRMSMRCISAEGSLRLVRMNSKPTARYVHRSNSVSKMACRLMPNAAD